MMVEYSTLAEEALAVRRKRANGGSGDDGGIGDREAYPKLCELLTVLPPGAKGVKTGRVALFVQDSRLTCCLSFPAIAGVAFIALDNFMDALAHVERSLRDRTVEWREDKPQGVGRKY